MDGVRAAEGGAEVRELRDGLGLGVDGRSATVFSRRTGPLRPYAGVAMRGMARGYAAGDSRDRGGARLRGRWVSCRLAVRPAEWLIHRLQPGQGATELGFPSLPAPGEMQSEAARRAGDPSHQSEDPPPEGPYLVITVRSHRPPRRSGPGYAPSPGPPARRRGGEAPRRHVVQPDRTCVAYGVLDRCGVAAMIGLQFQPPHRGR